MKAISLMFFRGLTRAQPLSCRDPRSCNSLRNRFRYSFCWTSRPSWHSPSPFFVAEPDNGLGSRGREALFPRPRNQGVDRSSLTGRLTTMRTRPSAEDVGCFVGMKIAGRRHHVNRPGISGTASMSFSGCSVHRFSRGHPARCVGNVVYGRFRLAGRGALRKENSQPSNTI